MRSAFSVNSGCSICCPQCSAQRPFSVSAFARGVSTPRQCSQTNPPVSGKKSAGFKPGLKLGEDFDLWIRIALRYKVAFLNEPLAYYNQDSNPRWRGIRRLPDPQFHMLWNLDYLAEEEESNPDLKQLLDNLRTYGLFPYYLSKRYRITARKELRKVNWDNQTQATRKLYHTPIFFLRCRGIFFSIGSFVKQFIIKYL